MDKTERVVIVQRRGGFCALAVRDTWWLDGEPLDFYCAGEFKYRSPRVAEPDRRKLEAEVAASIDEPEST